MLETQRLKLIPLTYEQVEKLRHLDFKLEDELGLVRSNRDIPDFYKDALQRYTLKWIQADPDNYLFATVWIIIDKSENKIAGDIGFKRKPDEKGYVELGYSTQPIYRGKGYMTEAIGAMVNWAFTFDDVKAVIAETLESNEASIKVLKNNGFTAFEHSKPSSNESGNNVTEQVSMKWWKIDKL